jgi:hypothetical protein
LAPIKKVAAVCGFPHQGIDSLSIMNIALIVRSP